MTQGGSHACTVEIWRPANWRRQLSEIREDFAICLAAKALQRLDSRDRGLYLALKSS